MPLRNSVLCSVRAGEKFVVPMSRFASLVAVAGLLLNLVACSMLPEQPWTTQESRPEPTAQPVPSPISRVVVEDAEYDRIKLQRASTLLEAVVRAGFSATDSGYYMDIQEARLRQQIAGSPVQVMRVENSISLYIPGVESFESGSSQLSDSIEPMLLQIGRVLVEFDKTLISVFGHTDDTGPDNVNQRISEQRGMSVAQHLMDQGVNRNRVLVVGYGESRPVASNETEEGRNRNRRVELRLEPLAL